MRVRISAYLMVCLGLMALSHAPALGAEADPKPIELWPKGAPGATGTSDEDKPAVTVYLPAPEKANGAAILVCPGGGFLTRCIDFEGVLVENWLRDHGITCFVLRYRIRPIYTMRESLADAQRGMQWVRAHADEYHVSPNRIGIIGFSAGSELACSASARAVAAKPESADPLDHFASRPDFMILAYGSSNVPAGTENAGAEAAAAQTGMPPTFLFCTAEDTGHLNGMLTLYTTLRRQRVPVEAHWFATGEHGVGFAQGDPTLGAWPDLMFNWVRAGGFLSGEKRVPLKGMVKMDGEALPRGAIILTPVDTAKGGAPVIGYVFNTGPVRGEYNIRADQGPVPGKYKVEVRQDATRWVSNSRDPLQLRMNQKARGGGLTDEDRKEWIEATRKRDLTPSIEGQRVYHKQHPGDANEIIVEIKPGDGNKVDVEIFSK